VIVLTKRIEDTMRFWICSSRHSISSNETC